MKKIITVLAMAVVAFCSCKKEELPQPQPSYQDRTIEFKLNRSVYSDSSLTIFRWYYENHTMVADTVWYNPDTTFHTAGINGNHITAFEAIVKMDATAPDTSMHIRMFIDNASILDTTVAQNTRVYLSDSLIVEPY